MGEILIETIALITGRPWVSRHTVLLSADAGVSKCINFLSNVRIPAFVLESPDDDDVV